MPLLPIFYPAPPSGLHHGKIAPAVVPRKLPVPFPFGSLSTSLARTLPLTPMAGADISQKAKIVEAEPQKEKTMSQPAHKIRDGVLQVTIWRNTGEKGNYYTVNPTRSYKQGDETWKETDSLNADDCLAMAELLREAYAWIKARKREDTKARKESEQAA